MVPPVHTKFPVTRTRKGTISVGCSLEGSFYFWVINWEAYWALCWRNFGRDDISANWNSYSVYHDLCFLFYILTINVFMKLNLEVAWWIEISCVRAFTQTPSPFILARAAICRIVWPSATIFYSIYLKLLILFILLIVKVIYAHYSKSGKYRKV